MMLALALAGMIPLLWGCLALLFVLVLLLAGYLIWQARRATRRSVAPESTEAAGSEKTPVSPALASELPGSFSGALSALRARVSGPDYRYTLPWYLLVGPPESGKTSLLSESSLSISLEEQIRVEQGAGLAWNFFENGIVIDVGGWAFSSAASAVSTWRRLLRLFVNHRPERPLDGILLTLAASDLTGSSALTSQELIEFGGMLQQRLRQITHTIGFQLPVYVILTKCDVIPGFTEFASELESEELQQIFGWSNPHGGAAEFESEWIDQAINFMRISLERKQGRIFAIHKPAETRPLMFLFPGALYELIPNLRLVLSKAFRFTTNAATPMLRGIYCCGATNMHLQRGPETAKLVPVSTPVASGPSPVFAFASAGLSWVPALLEPWLHSDLQIAFTHDLLLRKIFAEKSLAIPLAHHFVWRDRLRVSLQIASAVTALVLAVGTTFAYRNDARDRENLLPLLSTIRTSLQSPPSSAMALGPSINRASARSLIHAMASFETDGFISVFVPASWFDHINTSISQAMVPAFRVLVLQRFHRGLEDRIHLITDLNRRPLPEAALPPDGAGVPPSLQLERLPEFLQMRTFTGQVSELEHFVDVYNRLSSKSSPGPISSIIELDQYLHNESSPVPESEAQNPYFEQALREATWSPLAYTDDVRRQMSFKASQLTTALFSAWIEHNPTRTATEHLAASVDDLSGPSRHTYAQLAETKAAYDSLASAIADPDLRWTAAEQLSLPANLASVTTEPASHSPLFEPWLHDWMLDLADEDFRKLSSVIDQAETPLTGPLLKAEDNKLQLTDRAEEMQVALENLMTLPFMSAASMPAVGTAHMEASNFTWNKSSLDAAAALPVSYSRYVAEDLDQAPSAMRLVFNRIAADQLANSLVLAIEEAEQPAPIVRAGSGGSGVAQQAQALASVEDSITTLLATLQQNNLSLPYEQLRRASTTQAVNLLTALDRELAAAPPFGVSTAAISRWTAEGSPTGAIFDAPDPDSVAAYLSSQGELVESYSTIAAPLVSFLRQYSGGLSPASAKVLARWQGITDAVVQHKAKHPGNSIQLVEDFISTGADKITPAKACASAKAPMPAPRVADYFTVEAAELRRDIVARCQVLLNESFTRNYTLLYARFNRDLAGRFPFASATSSTVYEADPQQVAATFGQRDVVADVLAPPASTGEEIQIFLKELQEARPWFSSLLTTASLNQPPALDFIPSFRVDRDREVGGNQIIEWSMQVGGDVFRAGDAERKGHWTYGDPIILSFRWAKNAPFLPSSIVSAHPSYDMQVAGDTVTYTFKDAWSLLRLVRCFALPAYGSFSSDAFTLAFDIPESAGTGAKLQPSAVTSARVFLRLLVSAPGEKQSIRTTTFPQIAPALAVEQKSTGE